MSFSFVLKTKFSGIFIHEISSTILGSKYSTMNVFFLLHKGIGTILYLIFWSKTTTVFETVFGHLPLTLVVTEIFLMPGVLYETPEKLEEIEPVDVAPKKFHVVDTLLFASWLTDVKMSTQMVSGAIIFVKLFSIISTEVLNVLLQEF